MTYAHMVRWILVVPSVLLSFYLCVLLALAIYMAAESLCPEHLIVSEICTADYMNRVKEALLLLAPALAATLMVGSAYICAPSHKWKLAAITFLLGSAAALYYAFDSGYWYTLALTEVTSAATLYFFIDTAGMKKPRYSRLCQNYYAQRYIVKNRPHATIKAIFFIF